MGDYYNQQGRYQNAVKEYQEEANIYAKMGKKLEMAKAHRMVGEMFMLLSDFDKAKDNINDYLSKFGVELFKNLRIKMNKRLISKELLKNCKIKWKNNEPILPWAGPI